MGRRGWVYVQALILRKKKHNIQYCQHNQTNKGIEQTNHAQHMKKGVSRSTVCRWLLENVTFSRIETVTHISIQSSYVYIIREQPNYKRCINVAIYIETIVFSHIRTTTIAMNMHHGKKHNHLDGSISPWLNLSEMSVFEKCSITNNLTMNRLNFQLPIRGVWLGV